MIERFSIAGYARISVDEELDRDNTSIENQKAIITDFVKNRFPDSELTFFEDRDKSGYTFEQRPGYQAMRRQLMAHQLDILVVKDFSRFSRRNSRGLVELEDLRDAGIRIISIGDNVDYPNDDDWLKIQFQFLINEMPVTDTSKKVRAVVKRRQEDGKWICAAPYGYIVNARQEFELVPTEADIVRKIFQLYIDGWGYKRIANYLTDEHIPTPRMEERTRAEAQGKEYHREVKPIWAIVTVQGILQNDFYIGTLRQGKYYRKKINGKDVRRDVDEHIVIENHHQPIIDYRTFATARALMEKRTTSDYRGIKKYENNYTGFLRCGDCGSPMFTMSKPGSQDAYRCGLYHRRGLKGCTSHFVKVSTLDAAVKQYLRIVRDNSAKMLERLNEDIQKQDDDLQETSLSVTHLKEALENLQEELKATKRQRVRDMMKHPEQEALLEETYDEMETDLANRISGLQAQIVLTEDKRNLIIRVNRKAKTAMEVFDDILDKDRLDPRDLNLILDQIIVFEDHIDVKLKADIDTLLKTGELPEGGEEDAANFKWGTEGQVIVVQQVKKRLDKAFRVNTISEGDAQHQQPCRQREQRKAGIIDRGIGVIGRTLRLRIVPYHDGAHSQPEQRHGDQHSCVAGESARLPVIDRAKSTDAQHVEAKLFAILIQNPQIGGTGPVRLNRYADKTLIPYRRPQMRHVWPFHFQNGNSFAQRAVLREMQRNMSSISMKDR